MKKRRMSDASTRKISRAIGDEESVGFGMVLDCGVFCPETGFGGSTNCWDSVKSVGWDGVKTLEPGRTVC